MTQAIPQSSSDNSSGPPHGGQAFLEETRIGELSAAAQLLLIGTYLIGTREQTYFIQTDADELRVPFVQSVVGAHDTWKAPDKLESLIGLALQDHGAGPDSSDWRPGTPSRPEDQAALWRDVELTRSPLAGIALLGFSLWSPSEIQRVAAATVLHVFTEGAYPAASQVLYSFLQSTDSIAAQVAAAALKSRFEMPPTDTSTKPQALAGISEMSISIHGTWARVAEDRWYAPGSPLHAHIHDEVSENLYSGNEYFRWSGGYSEQERRRGAEDFPRWKDAQGIKLLDTVYAHSHGGNVALHRVAGGEQVRLLVLLHVPALPRPDEEWQRIRSNVGRVLIMRSRADLVMLADGLVNKSSLNFDQNHLPHSRVLPHWRGPDAWFSHSLFIDYSIWAKYSIANEVNYERTYAKTLDRPEAGQP